MIALLVRELDRRRAVLSDLSVQAETLSAYLDKGHAMPRIVVLIDGFQNLASIVGNVQSMVHGPLDWLGELHRVITDGRQVGMHVVLASDRRQGVPALVMSAISHRLVLRQTDEAAYADYGVPMAIYKGLELPGGRALWNNQMVQVGLISDDPSAAAQGAAIAEFAAAARSRPERLPDGLSSAPAPDEVFVPLRGESSEPRDARSPRRVRRPGRGRLRARRNAGGRSAAVGPHDGASADGAVAGGVRTRGVVDRHRRRASVGRAATRRAAATRWPS